MSTARDVRGAFPPAHALAPATAHPPAHSRRRAARSLRRNVRSVTHEDAYLTPLPPLNLRGAEDHSESPARASATLRHRSARHRIVAALALACIGGLVAAAVAPITLLFADTSNASTAANVEGDHAAGAGMSDGMGMVHPQQLVGSDAPGYSLGGPAAVEAAPVDASYTPQPETDLVDPALLENSPLRYPFARKMPVTDGFGYRTQPLVGFHDAQDIAAPEGTPVQVIGNGIVIEAGWANDGCGFSLKVQHLVDDETLTSRYCHMLSDSHELEVGDRVETGDVAGRVGNTGMSFGAHLHLALRLEGEPIDPLPYIAAKSA